MIFCLSDKIDSGVVTLNRQEIELYKLLDECLEETAGLKKPGQKIEIFRYSIDFLESDPFILKSILINLISNGLKYTADDGCVCVSTNIEQGEFHICVQDNGIGIPKTELENLFSRAFLEPLMRRKLKELVWACT
jgi:signal transduction histidine kinase